MPQRNNLYILLLTDFFVLISIKRLQVVHVTLGKKLNRASTENNHT